MLCLVNIEKFNFTKQVVAFVNLNLKHSQFRTFVHCVSRISRTCNVNNLCKKLLIYAISTLNHFLPHTVLSIVTHIRFVMRINTIFTSYSYYILFFCLYQTVIYITQSSLYYLDGINQL